MPTTAQAIIDDAQTALQDPTGVRWPALELLGYLNRAQMDIHTVRPDVTATVQPVFLVTGARQVLPAEAASLIDIPCNTNGPAITKVDVVQLDAVNRGWRQMRPTAQIGHFTHDLRNPRTFEVYPPAQGAQVDMEYSAYPTYVSLAGNVSLGDQWRTALYSMVLHYAYAKDAEFGGNAGLSAAYLQRAEQLLGTQLQTTATVAPKS